MRIIQVSDTHLSCEHDHFQNNVDIIAADLADQVADLFVHTGDVSMDGAGQRRDLELSRQWNDRLPGEVVSIPGNHDVGDLATNRPSQPVDDHRLAAWREVIGPDYWARAQGGWQLIGLDAMLFGTGHPAEDEQFTWLGAVLQTELPIAIFVHKPVCIDDVDEGARGYWTVPPEPRARLLALLAGKPVKMIASGHLHIERHQVIDGIDHVWAPAASFVVGASQEDLGGTRRLGYVEHVFDADRVTSRFVHPDGLEALLLDPVRDTIYPD